MQNTLKRVVCSFALLTLFSVSFLPLAAEAKTVVKKKTKHKTYYHLSISSIPGRDEKNFDNPASRCLTAAMVALNNAAQKRMDADVAKSGAGHDAAVQTYKDKLAIVWAAMAEPYCGYGSQGITAVKKSFNKSIERIRADFLAAVKK